MNFIVAETAQGEPVFINPAHIVYITPKVGLVKPGLKTEIRYMTYRLDVAYSKNKFDQLETTKLI